MVDFKLCIRREYPIDREVSKKTVAVYLKELNKEKREIEKVKGHYGIISNAEDKRLEEINKTIDRETAFCKFFFEYLKKQKEGFKWVFVKAEDREEYSRRHGDAWIKSNGKIKVIINIENNVSSTRISLGFGNDSKHLTFYERGYGEKTFYKNLRKKESIDEFVEHLKTVVAEKEFEQHIYPRYTPEKREFETLQRLLHCYKGEY